MIRCDDEMHRFHLNKRPWNEWRKFQKFISIRINANDLYNRIDHRMNISMANAKWAQVKGEKCAVNKINKRTE